MPLRFPALLLRRRMALAALAASPLPLRAEAASAQPGCVLTPQSIEGPYYLDPRLHRADLVEDRSGVPLDLRLVVMEAGPCTPIAGARVDVWGADAQGIYSGYSGQGEDRALDMTGRTFLRGTQFADAAGAVTFRTLWPGWYQGRTTHIHIKVILGERNVLTGQIYFPEAINSAIYGHVAAYDRRGRARDTFNCTDHIALGDAGHAGFAAVAEMPDRYAATLVLGVDRAATVTEAMPPPPGGPGDPRRGPPPPGGFPGMGGPPRSDRPVTIVPGVAPAGRSIP